MIQGTSWGFAIMQLLTGLIYSRERKATLLFQQICREIGVSLDCTQEIKKFLLQITEKEFRFFIFDCSEMNADGLDWVRLIRHIRPKIPLIILCDDVNQEIGGRLFEEGVFYLAIRPFQRKRITQVLIAALKQGNS